jgi:hypothetical protein
MWETYKHTHQQPHEPQNTDTRFTFLGQIIRTDISLANNIGGGGGEGEGAKSTMGNRKPLFCIP